MQPVGWLGCPAFDSFAALSSEQATDAVKTIWGGMFLAQGEIRLGDQLGIPSFPCRPWVLLEWWTIRVKQV